MEVGGLEKVDLTTSPLSLAKAVLPACMQSKCDKETLRDVILGFYATMLNTEIAQASETLSSINGDAARKQRIFPKKFTANCEAKPFYINATPGVISPAAAQKYLDKENLKLNLFW